MALKITTGIYKGRVLEPARDPRVRPTRNMVLQALFNMLGAGALTDKRVADLFCGTGQLGLEALSRGATHCTFVDIDTRPIRTNVEKLKVPDGHYNIITADVRRLEIAEKVDVLFADPPYAHGLHAVVLQKAANLLNNSGVLVLETEADIDLSPTLPTYHLTLVKHRTHGETAVWVASLKNIVS